MIEYLASDFSKVYEDKPINRINIKKIKNSRVEYCFCVPVALATIDSIPTKVNPGIWNANKRKLSLNVPSSRSGKLARPKNTLMIRFGNLYEINEQIEANKKVRQSRLVNVTLNLLGRPTLSARTGRYTRFMAEIISKTPISWIL